MKISYPDRARMMKMIVGLLVMTSAVFGEENKVTLNPEYVSGEYTFSGTVETVMGDFKSTHTFSGETTKDTFEFTWVNDMGMMKQTGEVKVDKDGGTMTMEGLEDSKFTDPELAIASATGVSGGSAHLMYSLWKGNRSAVFPDDDVKVSQKGAAIEVSGLDGGTARRSVVTVTGGRVVSVKTEFDPSQEKQSLVRSEMSDAEIKDLLKAMGKPDTQDEIDEMKAMMKQAAERVSGIKEKIITMTKIEVVGLADPK